MKIRIVPFLLLASLLPLRAQDQDSSQQPPTGPLLNRVSAPAEWTITTKVAAPQPGAANGGAGATGSPGNAAPPPKPAKPKVATIIKDEKLIYETIVNEQGDLSETWRTPAAMASRVNAKDWSALPGVGSDFNNTDYSKIDFAGFNWISQSNFTGRGSVLGKKCLIFKSKVLVMNAEELQMAKEVALNKLAAINPNLPDRDVSDEQFKVEVEADIDEQTRLPVMLTYPTAQGTATRTYSFKSPEKTLELPAEVQQVLNKYEKYLKSMSARIAPI